MARSDASIFNRMFDVVHRNAVAIAVPWESRDGCACEPIGRTARSPVEGQSVTRTGSDNWRSLSGRLKLTSVSLNLNPTCESTSPSLRSWLGAVVEGPVQRRIPEHRRADHVSYARERRLV
jgi:hypothetical protein